MRPRNRPAGLTVFGYGPLEHFARKLGIPVETYWDYATGRKTPPAGLAAAMYEEFFPLGEDDALTSVPNAAKVRDDMQTNSPPVGPRGRKVGRPIESRHPFAQWLKAQNITITEWAASHTDPDTGRAFKRERAKSWIAEGDGGRPVPEETADMIAEESKDPKTGKPAVPATDRVWANGIRRK